MSKVDYMAMSEAERAKIIKRVKHGSVFDLALGAFL